MKDEFLQRAAKWWAMAQGNEMPAAETVDQAKKIYRQSQEGTIVSTAQVEQLVTNLKKIKEAIKALEADEEKATVILQNYMAGKTELITPRSEEHTSELQSH